MDSINPAPLAVTIEAAAQLLAVSPRTVYRLAEAGRIRNVRITRDTPGDDGGPPGISRNVPYGSLHPQRRRLAQAQLVDLERTGDAALGDAPRMQSARNAERPD